MFGKLVLLRANILTGKAIDSKGFELGNIKERMGEKGRITKPALPVSILPAGKLEGYHMLTRFFL